MIFVAFAMLGMCARLCFAIPSDNSHGAKRATTKPLVNQDSRSLYKDTCDDVMKGYCEPEISRHWGMLSPYFTRPNDISQALPGGCNITFVQVLSRHGARFPDWYNRRLIKDAICTLQRTANDFPGKYQFLRDYVFSLGVSQQTDFGQQQMINSGIKFYEQYATLAKGNNPFCRAAGSKRVIMAAYNFTQGFAITKSYTMKNRQTPHLPILIIPEKPGQNNTLHHGACRVFEQGPAHGLIQRRRWARVFAPAIKRRINKDLGTTLKSSQIVPLMDLCPFDTVAHPGGKVSKFCSLFTEDEWKSYNYYYTLSKYHGFGAGDLLGPSQGIGWVTELIARLTGTPVNPQGSVNRTLDSNTATFPLDHKLYVDFTHDTDMVTIYYAMGLYGEDEPDLDDKHLDKFDPATAVPFAGRMYVEKMYCGAEDSSSPELVRVLINDRVVPLKCGIDQYGRCTLKAFIKSLKFAWTGGNWHRCKPKKTVSNDSGSHSSIRSSARVATACPMKHQQTPSDVGCGIPCQVSS